MLRPLPLQRGVSGGRISESNQLFSWDDSQKKDKSSHDDHAILSMSYVISLLYNSPSKVSKSGFIENGYGSDSVSNTGSPRTRLNVTFLILKYSLVLILILALSGSLCWTISITNSSRVYILKGYEHIQERLVSEIMEIGELSQGATRLKEVEFCPRECENRVPCFDGMENITSGERHCGQGSQQSCLVLPPNNYKVPLRWPTGKDIIWLANVNITAQQVLTSGSLTKRMMMLEEDQISFRSGSLMFDGIEDYSHQIAEMIGLSSESNFNQAGVRIVLDIGCGYGSFGAHLISKQLMAMCFANYEDSGSQVQLTLERGLPAIVGSFSTKQFPYPSVSFDMVHCAGCGVEWDQRDGIFLVEVDRVLRPGGYFVWTSPLTKQQGPLRKKMNQENLERWALVQSYAVNLCWEMLSQQDETVVWKKTTTTDCYASRKSAFRPPICSKGQDVESPYYRPLKLCVGGTRSRRWIPIEKRTTWPSRAQPNSTELRIHGVPSDDFAEDALNWKSAVRNYWSLLSPLLFSDHPKRPGDEDPSPPYNMLRNVMDMNAQFGGFNSALLEAGKSVWVMNVVPTTASNYLPLILDRGFVGVLHDWCEAFPTYPRTYDMVHAEGLLSIQNSQPKRCTMLNLFVEMDRLLRPEGWVILHDKAPLIETARALAARLKWDARVVEIESHNEERLLICQKPLLKT